MPTILTTGTRDLLQSDSVRFYWKLHEAGATVQLRVWEGMGHGFEGVSSIRKASRMQEVFGFLKNTSEQACPVGLNV